jgi:hypothetical protein
MPIQQNLGSDSWHPVSHCTGKEQIYVKIKTNYGHLHVDIKKAINDFDMHNSHVMYISGKSQDILPPTSHIVPILTAFTKLKQHRAQQLGLDSHKHSARAYGLK